MRTWKSWIASRAASRFIRSRNRVMLRLEKQKASATRSSEKGKRKPSQTSHASEDSELRRHEEERESDTERAYKRNETTEER